jgi:hypothetical protein
MESHHKLKGRIIMIIIKSLNFFPVAVDLRKMIHNMKNQS